MALTEWKNAGSTIYCLGSGTTFDIKTLLPDVDYTKLTKDNFIIKVISSSVSLDEDITSIYHLTTTPQVTYDAITGIATLTGLSNSYYRSYYDGAKHVSLSNSISIMVYLIDGEVETI
ncbi:MAG: hypothetical protein PHP50_13840 [Lachnospiraceae bacterium]|nr:hypothetical protein [Lachnospiraceae bacterium]